VEGVLLHDVQPLSALSWPSRVSQTSTRRTAGNCAGESSGAPGGPFPKPKACFRKGGVRSATINDANPAWSTPNALHFLKSGDKCLETGSHRTIEGSTVVSGVARAVLIRKTGTTPQALFCLGMKPTRPTTERGEVTT
jgi:hypothetical protein